MSEPKLIAPLLEGYTMGSPISQRRGVCCCPAIDATSQQKYIVKIISIPASQTQLDALLLTGAYPDNDAALAYFKDLADDTVREAQTLQRLAKLEGFCAYDAWQVEPMDDGVGYNVYLKGEYRTTLKRYLSQNTMTHLAAVNLGLDLCSALSACRRSGYLYVNTQPSNIMIGDDREYRLGDLGFVSLSSLQYASLPEQYRSCYTAPEVNDAYAALNTTMDIYAVGLVMYQVYNNGRLPFDGSAPSEPLPPPPYADYEMAEIILKACAPDPAHRWEDPAQMGQALVSYMQRNSVNDTPIIPPVADLSEEPEAEALEISAEAEGIAVPSDLPPDETAPTEELAAEMDDAALSDETSEMLAQADELIAHELPQPVVAPEPIDVPIPEPIRPEPEAEETEEAAPAAVAVLTEDEPQQDGNETATEAEESPEPDEEEEELSPKKNHTKLLIILASVLSAVLLLLGGYLFYTQYYLQSVDGISLRATQNQLTVLLDTDIDNSLLTVYCTDTYSNKRQATVENNAAHFTDLRPDTNYKITVEISGFHKLTGVTTGSHTTAAQTLITSFTAVTGAENGSVILNFAVQGPESSAWRVRYSAAGEAEKTVDFTGHLVTVTGLTIGKEYTFRLEPASTLYMEGAVTLKYTATNIVYAQELTPLGFRDGKLTVTWKAPDGISVNSWTARCYNDAGFDKTVTVTDTAASFEGLDATSAYTIEVKAEGMTVGSITYVYANSVTVTDIQADSTDLKQLLLSWNYEGKAPTGGWLVLYRVDGGEQNVVQCANGETSAVIAPLIPGAHYDITIQPADGGTVFGGAYEYDTSAAPLFSGYWVTYEHMEFSMCRRPAQANWNRNNVKAEDYTTTFQAGQVAGFVVRLRHQYTTSNDKIEILFVIRNAENIPVSFSTVTRTWTNMWYQGYGTLDVPALPEEAGSYTMEIYYNGASVTTQSFTIA